MTRRAIDRFRDAAFVDPARLEQAHDANEWRRDETRREQALAQQRRTEEMSKEKSPMGHTRAQTGIKEVHDLIGSAYQRLDEVLDEVGAAMQRERNAAHGAAAQRDMDRDRMTAVRNRGA